MGVKYLDFASQHWYMTPCPCSYLNLIFSCVLQHTKRECGFLGLTVKSIRTPSFQALLIKSGGGNSKCNSQLLLSGETGIRNTHEMNHFYIQLASIITFLAKCPEKTECASCVNAHLGSGKPRHRCL